MTDNAFDWSLARWIEEISELKPKESGMRRSVRGEGAGRQNSQQLSIFLLPPINTSH